MLTTGRTGPCWWMCTRGDVTEADHEQIVTTLRAWTASTTPACLLHVAHDARAPAAAQRDQISSIIRGADARQLRGFALVTNSALIRGAILAINWMAENTIPQRAFARPGDALRWLRQVHDGVDASAVHADIAAADGGYATLRW